MDSNKWKVFGISGLTVLLLAAGIVGFYQAPIMVNPQGERLRSVLDKTAVWNQYPGRVIFNESTEKRCCAAVRWGINAQKTRFFGACSLKSANFLPEVGYCPSLF